MNMPSATVASASPRADARKWGIRETQLAEIAYLAFLLVVFITITPFPPPISASDASATGSGAGDSVRQIAYLGVFALVLGTAALRLGLSALRAIPLLFVLVLAWCVLSSGWSLEPDVTLRRAVLVAIVSLSTFLSVETVGAERSLRLLRYVLMAVLVICWVGLPFIAQARHLADDFEPAVAGDWRGLYAHKNIAGAVFACAAMVFFHYARTRRSRLDLFCCVASVAFLIGTNSKSSMGLLPVALGAGWLFRICADRPFTRRVGLVFTALIGTAAALGIFLYWDAIIRLVSDPAAFTGRAAIWQAELAYIRDHPLFGSGYGTFAYTGASSPIYEYIDSAWVGAVANGHNGYLELLVTLGIPGFVAAMLSFFVQPTLWFASKGFQDREFKALLISFFLFFVLHNFMETDFLRTDGAEWVTFLLAAAMLRTSIRSGAAPAQARLFSAS